MPRFRPSSLASLAPLCILAAACGTVKGQHPSIAAAAIVTPAAAGDARIQRIVSEEIDRFAGEWGATRALVVVVDPKSGAVLAMDGRDHGRAEPSLASTRACVTGSTLKPITIAAALDASTITLDQRFKCGERAYGEHALHDAAEGSCAPLDARGAVAQSSNVATSYVFDTLGSARLAAWLGKLHIGDAPGKLPQIDDDRSIRAAFFGGGEVAEATPLQMARAYAAIFNDGVYVMPSGDPGAPSETRVMKAETARTVVGMLENVVGGDGNAKLARVAGARAAGKTGTADIKGEAGEDLYYVSFVGTVLDREPRFVALVGMEVPEGKATGPSAAAPSWARLAARIVGGRSAAGVVSDGVLPGEPGREPQLSPLPLLVRRSP